MGNKVVNQQGQVIGTVVDEVVKDTPIIRKDITAIETSVYKNGYSAKTFEKLLAYLAGLIAATNGFSQIHMPTSTRDTLMGAAGLVLAALHVSTP